MTLPTAIDEIDKQESSEQQNTLLHGYLFLDAPLLLFHTK
jgi:hypothetical protein